MFIRQQVNWPKQLPFISFHSPESHLLFIYYYYFTILNRSSRKSFTQAIEALELETKNFYTHILNWKTHTCWNKSCLINKNKIEANLQQNLLGPTPYCEKEAFGIYHVQNAQQPKRRHHISTSGYWTAIFHLNQKVSPPQHVHPLQADRQPWSQTW